MRSLIEAAVAYLLVLGLLLGLALLGVAAVESLESEDEPEGVGARTREMITDLRRLPREDLSPGERLMLETYEDRAPPETWTWEAREGAESGGAEVFE